MAKPVWLLDVDGVLNACRDPKLLPKGFPPESWHLAQVDAGTRYEGGYEAIFPILWSEVVRDFLLRMNDRVEIRWHTTWQTVAYRISDALGLPHYLVSSSDWDLHNGRDYPPKGWWKMSAPVNVVLEELRPLIWTDDDLNKVEQSTFWARIEQKKGVSTLSNKQLAQYASDPRAKVVQPAFATGLTQANLDDIEKYIQIAEAPVA